MKMKLVLPAENIVSFFDAFCKQHAYNFQIITCYSVTVSPGFLLIDCSYYFKSVFIEPDYDIAIPRSER